MKCAAPFVGTMSYCVTVDTCGGVFVSGVVPSAHVLASTCKPDGFDCSETWLRISPLAEVRGGTVEFGETGGDGVKAGVAADAVWYSPNQKIPGWNVSEPDEFDEKVSVFPLTVPGPNAPRFHADPFQVATKYC